MVKTTIRLLLALFGFVLIGWGIGALCRAELTPTDLRIVQDVASQRTSTQTVVWHVVSFIGSGYVVFPLAFLCCARLYRRRRRDWSAALGVSTLGAVVIANLDKVIAGRPRPPVHHLEAATGQSFPSGHVAHTAAFCAALLFVLHAAHQARRLRVAAAVATGLLVAGVAFSRVYLGVHYPSDVAAGALLGGAWSAVTWHLCAAPGAHRAEPTTSPSEWLPAAQGSGQAG